MDKKITFATNTANNTLEYTKLLLKSLKENLDNKEHEILIFVDSDNDGTVDYLKSIKSEFYDLKIVTHKLSPIVGPERNCNLIVELAKHDIVSYLQNDMVVSKHYDTQILNALEDNTIMSSTRIEPPLHGTSNVTFTSNFGLSPDEFKFDEFVSYAETIKSNKLIDYFFAPYTFHKSTWNKIGGYDTVFRRSRCDSDLVQRCLHLDIKLKQTYSANVYHFTCVSSRGKNWFDNNNEAAQKRVGLQNIADQIEMRRFVKKWGNFNHGETKLKKYDCDLVIKGSTESYVADSAYHLEPYFSRVWIDYQNSIDKILEKHASDHDPANQLYNFTNNDWELSKKYYNEIDYSKIYLLGSPKEYSVKIELDLDSQNENFLSPNTLLNLWFLIDQTEPGDYESGNCLISIKNRVDLTPNLRVENPQFDMSLLTIE
jgi:GT2 family glycosyltransferase